MGAMWSRVVRIAEITVSTGMHIVKGMSLTPASTESPSTS